MLITLSAQSHLLSLVQYSGLLACTSAPRNVMMSIYGALIPILPIVLMTISTQEGWTLD